MGVGGLVVAGCGGGGVLRRAVVGVERRTVVGDDLNVVVVSGGVVVVVVASVVVVDDDVVVVPAWPISRSGWPVFTWLGHPAMATPIAAQTKTTATMPPRLAAGLRRSMARE